MDIKLVTTDSVGLLKNLKENFKKIKEAFANVSNSGGGGTTGAIIDGGNPSTNHNGNLKIDFGSVN